MNCTQARELWDDYRDGSLTDAPRYSFEQHLGRCPACAALWQAESRWLTELERDPAEMQPDAAPFAEWTARRWAGEERRAGAVLTRITPWVSVAAAAAIAVSLLSLHARRPVPSAPVARAADPVGALVVEVARSIDQKPAAVADTVRQTAAAITFDRLLDVLQQLDPLFDLPQPPRSENESRS